MEILRARNPDDFRRWGALVDSAPLGDAYFRPGYALAYEHTEPTEAVALVLGSSQDVLIPLLLREVEFKGRKIRDAYSPYGYGGVLPLFEEGLLQLPPLADLLRLWCVEQNLTCFVLRMHPLMWPMPPDHDASSYRMQRRGTTIGIDLSEWSEEKQMIANLAKGRRSDLMAARRELTTDIFHGGDVDRLRPWLEQFIAMYRSAMEQLGADPFLKFPAEYFFSMARGLGEKFRLVSAFREGRMVGGSIFLVDGPFSNYHLSATNSEGRKYKAATLLINAGAQEARAQGCQWLHLGGGLRENDSLFEFKRSFGGRQFEYGTLLGIAQPEAYRELHDSQEAPWPYCLP